MALRYGLVQARIQVPGGCGIWPAFWMLGQDIGTTGWSQCGEIDVMEVLGHDPEVVHGTVHGPGYSGNAGVTASCRARASLTEGFHIYSVAWEPGRIGWHLDDQLYAAVAPGGLQGRPWVFRQDFYLLINVVVGGTFPGNPDTSRTFPRAMLIDYIRHSTSSPG